MRDKIHIKGKELVQNWVIERWLAVPQATHQVIKFWGRVGDERRMLKSRQSLLPAMRHATNTGSRVL